MSDGAFDAWHLPDLDVRETGTLNAGALTCRYPLPTPALVDAAIAGLRDAGAALTARPVDELVEIIDAAAARLADPEDQLREEADRAVAAAAGFSIEMTRLVLDRMTADWRAEPLRRLLAAELDDPAALDAFHRVADGWWTRAYGPELAFHVFAGSVPGVAVTSLVRSLLVKAPALGKLASSQPVLPVLFARAVAGVDPDVGRALAVTYWPGGVPEAEAAERRALRSADAVVVYGGRDVVAAYRDNIGPEARLVVHGPRLSVGLVAADALADLPALAADVARSVAMFDQHGCVSPHAVWVEAGGAVDPATFAEAVAGALAELEAEIPRGRLSTAEASAIQQERAAAELKAHAAGGPGRVFAGPGTSWTVVLDPDPELRPSCLNRFVRIHPVADLEDAIDRLAPAAALLQSVALAGAHDRRHALADRLARTGATRVTTFDRLPFPQPAWHHDGAEPLRELIRWVDLET